MPKPKVTVMMPAYNAAKYIAESIGSVLRQDFEDFELLIVDDGSKDATMEIAALFKKDQRVRIYKNSENRGEGYTRNRILRLSRGKYIVPHDADDIMLQGRIEKQVRTLEKNSEFGGVCGRVLICNEEARQIEGELGGFDDGKALLKEGRLNKLPAILNHSSAMMVKRLMLLAGGYDSRMPFDVDVRLIRRLFKLTPFYFLNHFCFLYRRHPASLMQGYRARRAREMRGALSVQAQANNSKGIVFPVGSVFFRVSFESKKLIQPVKWRLNYYLQCPDRKAVKPICVSPVVANKEFWSSLGDRERYFEEFLQPLLKGLWSRARALIQGALVSKNGEGILLLSDQSERLGEIVLSFLRENFYYHAFETPILSCAAGKIYGESLIDPIVLSRSFGIKLKAGNQQGLFWNSRIMKYCLNVDQYQPSLIGDECVITRVLVIRVVSRGAALRKKRLYKEELLEVLSNRFLLDGGISRKIQGKFLKSLTNQADGFHVILPKNRIAELPRKCLSW